MVAVATVLGNDLGMFTISILAGTIRVWLSSDPARLIRLRAVGGAVMIGLGVFTFLNSLIHN